MIGPAFIFPLNSVGDLLMALAAIIMGAWIYKNGPQANRVMLRYWVMAFVTLCFAGLLGAVLEGMGSSMSHSERMASRLGLAALYMGAGLFQLFAVLEITHYGSWGKDLIMGGSGAAYLIVIVVAVLYKFPDSKMFFLAYSSVTSFGALLLVGRVRYPRLKWLILAAMVQLLGVAVYFFKVSFLGVSYSLLLNLLMFAGMLFYLKGLKEMTENDWGDRSMKKKEEKNERISPITTTL